MAQKITVGARVMFSGAVVRQAGHSERVANMRGVVLEVVGRVARVDSGESFISEDGRRVRGIPLANLSPVTR